MRSNKKGLLEKIYLSCCLCCCAVQIAEPGDELRQDRIRVKTGEILLVADIVSSNNAAQKNVATAIELDENESQV